MKIIVKQYGKKVETLKTFGNEAVMTNCYNREVRIHTWADAMNYIDTDGGRTCTGRYYYDDVEEAWEDYVESFGGCDVDMTKEEFISSLDASTIAELSQGEIEFVEDEE